AGVPVRLCDVCGRRRDLGGRHRGRLLLRRIPRSLAAASRPRFRRCECGVIRRGSRRHAALAGGPQMKRSLAALASVAVLLVGGQSAASPSPTASSGAASPGATQPAASAPASLAVVTPAPSITAPKSGHWVAVTADEEPVDNRIALGDGRVLNLTVS